MRKETVLRLKVKDINLPFEERKAALEELAALDNEESREALFTLANDGYLTMDLRQKAYDYVKPK
jgi:hypothetical protein